MQQIIDAVDNLGNNFNQFKANYDNRLDHIEQALSIQGASGLAGGGKTGTSGFKSLGDYLLAVRSAGLPGGRVDEKLYIANEASGLNEGTPSDGGFLVHSDFSTNLLDLAARESLLYPRTNRFQVAGNSIVLPAVDESSRATGSRWGGVRTYWSSEASQATSSKPKFREMKLSLKKLIGLAYATDELIEDSAVLAKVIGQSFADEIAFMRDDAILRGVGGGQPLGILNSGALVTVDAETGQATDTVIFDNVLKMFSRMVPRSRKNAVWLINQSVEPQLYSLALDIGTGGGPVFLPAGGASEAPYSTLFGRPVLLCESCSALGDLGDILFIDPTQYVLAEKAGGIKVDASIHLRFDYDESAFRFVYRFDGQPAWDQALTPYKGADDLSPFVALAAR